MSKLGSCSGGKGNRDILSYLPDSVRSHVVSFLPMKDAFRTKILSRTWRNICSTLSNLDFDKSDFKSLLHFRNLVDKTLILHDGSDIRNFYLSFQVDNEFLPIDHVHAWITFAIQHNVQHLVLLVSYSSPTLETLPLCFFTCSTLSMLSLSNCDSLKWPMKICFPMLKSLDLISVMFYDENVTTKLFSSSACPVLDYLSIYYCKFEGMHTLSISFPSLKSVKLLSLDSLNVNLSAPVLRKLYCNCPLLPNISSDTISSLFDVSLILSMPDSISGELAFRNSTRRILMGLHNVNTLFLSIDIMEVLAKDPDLLSYLPASYSNLKHFLFQITSTKSHIEVIACLLRTSPSLQSLTINISVRTSSAINQRPDYWQLNELSIANSLKQLKTVLIMEFGGSESEMYIVRRLIESASILEKMDIYYADELQNDTEKKLEISKKVLSFKKVSPHATILLS